MSKYLLTACLLTIIAFFTFITLTVAGYFMVGAASWGLFGYAIFYLGAMEGISIATAKDNDEETPTE